jgi:alkanesulfonate monooxygenase SsuD/methylene tetrahydromethanopterin reductase-like flavin-dependent oxidoreductase (luciferase family)
VTQRRGHPMRIGLKLSQGAPIDVFRDVWRIADEGGFDHCWAFDHLASLDESGQPRLLFEGWSLVSAMAVATARPRIGLLVGGMAYRHPALLAKIAVTVDHLSGGRLEFGIGAGWAARERAMYDIDDSNAVGRFKEGIEVLELLWSGQRVSYEGAYYRLQDAVAMPAPVQRPRPPIWIGADGPRMLRLTAERGDVWIPAGEGLDAARDAAARLEDCCRDAARDPMSIRWSTQVAFDGSDPDSAIDELQRWADAGFSELVVYCAGDDPVRAATVAAERILPALRG